MMRLIATVLPKTDSLIRLGVNCPFCGFPFHPGDRVIFCPNDNTPHHAACWQQNGNHCTLLGCTGAGEIVIPVTVAPKTKRTSIVPFVVGGIVTLCIVGLLIFGLGNMGIVTFGSSSPVATFITQTTSTLVPPSVPTPPTRIAEATRSSTVAASALPSITAIPLPSLPTSVGTALPNCARLSNMPIVSAGQVGAPDKPIVITFVPFDDPVIIARAGNEIADCLSKMTGLAYKIEVAPSFAASVEALGANRAQVGFLNNFSALVAKQKYGVEPALAAQRVYFSNAVDPDKDQDGKLAAFYRVQFIVKTDSGIRSFADLRNKMFCFVDPNSISGYIVPRIVLKANGIDPDRDFKATYVGSHQNVAIAVYKSDCDAGAVFVDVLTDTATNLKRYFPDIASKVSAFAVSDRIPNEGILFVKDLSPRIKLATADGLYAMSNDPGGNSVLRRIRSINGLQKVDVSFYDEFASLMKRAGVDPATLVK